MNKEDLIVGVHGGDSQTGGHYNVMGSFTTGLFKGFQNSGVKVYSTKECFEKNLSPNLTIGFNVTGYETWAQYLNHNVTNIMWSMDSIFFQNIEAVAEFYNNPKFVLFNVSPADNDALKAYMPQLQFEYMPHAIDPLLWKKQNVKKEYDIAFLGSIIDFDAKIEELKQIMPQESFDLLMMIYDTWVNSPNLPFWQLYKIFEKEGGLNFNLGQYNFAFKNLSQMVSHTKRVQMIEKLSDFNVKVFGDGPWEKYIKGKVEYMGPCDLSESINVVNKSRIILHNHPAQLALGIHDRILGASAVEAFVISSENDSISREFGDSIGYYKNANFENLEENIEYYLKNVNERIEKAKVASEITLQKHTWDVRAAQILNMINYN